MISVGKEAIEGSNQPKHYVGVGSYIVRTINPSKEEIMKLQPWRTEIKDSEVNYISKREDGTTTLKLDFYIQLSSVRKGTQVSGLEIDEDGNVKGAPVEKITFFMTEAAMKSANKGTYQVVDAFGTSAWVEVNEGKIVLDPSKSYGISTEGVRVAYMGEVSVLEFMRALFNVPTRVHPVAGGGWKVDVDENQKEELDACRLQIENPKKLFTGDISEISIPVKSAVGYKVKLLRGIRTLDDGRQFTEFYTNKPMKNSVISYGFLEKSIKNDKDQGRLANRYFGEPPYDFKEFTAVPTSTQSLTSMDTPMPGSNPVGESTFGSDWDMPSF